MQVEEVGEKEESGEVGGSEGFTFNFEVHVSGG